MKKIIVVGSGGHGKVLIYTLKALGLPIHGAVDSRFTGEIGGVHVLGNDSWLLAQSPDDFTLVNGIGSISFPEVRKKIFETYKDRKFKFMTVVHPSAIVDPSAHISEGSQVLAGAIIQPHVKIDVDVIINTGSIIEHDCVIGPHCHIAPGCVLSGAVQVGNTCHIGTGATIIQGINIGDGCLIAAGAVVTQNVLNKLRVAGVPAKPF
jgi:sugar O-acyltransferase (sialic acid O-acetyltransferase NeuD family)